MKKKLPKLDLNITNRCNFRCVHCAFDSGIAKMNEMTVPELQKILVDTKHLGGERIDLTGGEPTLRKDLNEIIRIGKSLSYRIELVTNGSLLDKKRLQEFKKLGLDAIAISMDGSSYDTYKRIRKVNLKTYKRVLQTIKLACQLGFYVKINTVVFKCNMSDIPEITEFCIKSRISEHGLYYFTPIGRGNSAAEDSVEPKQWLEFIRSRLIKYSPQIRLSVEIPFIEKNKAQKNLGCIVGENPYHLQILPDGNAYPCAILASYHKPIRNLHESSVKDIWRNTSGWKGYLNMLEKDIFSRFCGSCVDYSGIRAGKYTDYMMVCPLRKFRNGDLNA
jgi:mycofactocin biosynthetic radical S-adenosylmethionine protein MftC